MVTTTRAATLVGYKAVSDVAGKLAVLGILMLAARRLPTAEFGFLALATTLGWIASVASDFGLQLHLGRAIARATDPARVLWPLFKLRLGSAGLALLAVAAGAVVLAPPGLRVAFLLVACAPLLTSVSEFLNYAYRGLGRSDLESSINLAQRLSALALVAAGLSIAPSLTTVGVALAASALAALLASLVIAKRLLAAYGGRVLQMEAGSLDPATTPDLKVRPPFALSFDAWRRDVAPIGVGLLLSALYFRIDVFLIEYWTGVEAVAHYSAVFRLVDAMRLVPAAVLTVALPRLFGPRDARFAWQLAAGLTAFAVLVTAMTLPLAGPILEWAYGSPYGTAIGLFQVLLLSFPLLTLNYSLTHQLIGWDGQRYYARCCAIALVVNLALNAWLIPGMGALGAAWATLGTEVALTLTCLAALQHLQRSR
jgi:O-antigen/teichoic acid export membrane protein